MPNLESEYPLALLLFFLLPVILYAKKKTKLKLPFTYTSKELLASEPSFLKKHYDSILYILIFSFITLAIVNIGYSERTVKEFIESKWIIVALDISGSMKRTANPQNNTSIEDVAVYGAEKFISMRGKHDSIGLIVFSSTANLLSPLTFDKDILNDKLNRLQEKSRFYREMSVGGGTNVPAAIWRSLTVFFSMLPRENKLSVSEIASLRNYLTGDPDSFISMPSKLENIGFGKGMSVIVLTDGRIAPSKRVQSENLPNFFNTLKLMKELNVKLYIISIGEELDQDVVDAMNDSKLGRIFITPKTLDKKTIEEIYGEINKLEKNRILSKVVITHKSLRQVFVVSALFLLFMLFCLKVIPGYRKI